MTRVVLASTALPRMPKHIRLRSEEALRLPRIPDLHANDPIDMTVLILGIGEQISIPSKRDTGADPVIERKRLKPIDEPAIPDRWRDIDSAERSPRKMIAKLRTDLDRLERVAGTGGKAVAPEQPERTPIANVGAEHKPRIYLSIIL